jgi:nicotinate-nucleotide pyrophosphorylase (carboxylating)
LKASCQRVAHYNRLVNWLLVDKLLREALAEDTGFGDVTSELALPQARNARGTFVAKGGGILCGGPVAQRAFELLDPAAHCERWLPEGPAVVPGTVLGEVRCDAKALLAAERVALNLLQRLCGIASATARLAARAAPLGIRITETRKTSPSPGMRMLEKYAVRCGGGHNHRSRLDGGVLLKDNHFLLSGMQPDELVERVRAGASHALRVEAEATSIAMAEAVARAGADIVLLDNFAPGDIRIALDVLRSPAMAAARLQLGLGRPLVEVSGGVNEANLDNYLIEGVDVISIGALTHSSPALDISLEAGPA